MSAFRDLHHQDTPLVLPNAWDLGSGIAFAAAGFAAIGTTSFGVAAAGGAPDGKGASRDATVALAAALCRLPVLVTADIEDGYSEDAASVAALVADLASVGVAGVNLEDSADGHLVAPEDAAAKIAAVKARTPDVFVNARVDNIWFAEDATVEAVLARAGRYTDAGADGIFVPGLSDPDQIRAVAAGIGLPLNVLAHPTLSAARLADLGVRRISSGSLPYRVSVDAAVRAVEALRDGAPLPAATSYGQMQDQLRAVRDGAGG